MAYTTSGPMLTPEQLKEYMRISKQQSARNIYAPLSPYTGPMGTFTTNGTIGYNSISGTWGLNEEPKAKKVKEAAPMSKNEIRTRVNDLLSIIQDSKVSV